MVLQFLVYFFLTFDVIEKAVYVCQFDHASILEYFVNVYSIRKLLQITV